MAQFLVVRDPDDGRRRSAVETASSRLSGDLGLTVASAERDGLAVVWGVTGSAPVALHQEAGTWCLVIGEVLAGPGSVRSGADTYARAHWDGAAAPFDGLHLGIVHSTTHGLTVGTDLLGIFPVYHTRAGEALLIGSAPGLFRCHPSFREELDPAGLAALLLTNGLIDGLTLQRGVRRLAAGHLLKARPGQPASEALFYQVPVTTLHHDQPLEEWGGRLYQSLAGATRRHVMPDLPHALLLSGGHDSRLLAGLLARQDVAVTALTQGLPSDNDYRCARRVARQLSFPHRLVAHDDGDWTSFRDSVRWNGMASSPGLRSEGVVRAVRTLHTRVVSGYLMDAIVGGSHIHWCYSHKTGETGFDPWFNTLNQHGIRLDTLRRLLRPEVFGDSLDDMLARVRHRFMELGDSNLERAWRFDLEHRQRFNIGTMLLRLMRGCWPVTPHIDREVLATAGGIPLGALANRVVEREILIRFQHELARLPLDRGSDPETTPLDPDLRSVLGSIPGRVLRKAAQRLGVPRKDRSYYARRFSFEGPGWREVREAWEAVRPAAYTLFVPEVLDRLLPRPGEPWPEGFRQVDTVGRRILLGTGAWIAS